jgi:O-antigen/teichoic acid export membrane protein
MKGHFREIGKDFVKYGFMSAVSQMSGLLLMPLFTRVLSVDEYGVVDVIATFVSLISIGMRLALPNGLARYYGAYSVPGKRARLATTLVVLVLGFSLFVALGLSFSGTAEWLSGMIIGDVGYSPFIQLGCWIALMNSVVAVPQVILRLERRIVALNLSSLLSTVLYATTALYFVFALDKGVAGVFYAQLLSTMVLLAVTLVLTLRYFALDVSIHDLRHTLAYSLPLLPNLLSTWINNQTDRLLLLLLMGLSAVGVFGAAARVSRVVLFLLEIFSQGWDPYAMLLIASERRDEVYRRMLSYYVGAFAAFGLLLTGASPELYALLLPGEYHAGYVIVPWLVGSAILHRSGSLTKLGITVSEKTVGISLSSAVGVVLNVAIAFVLIPRFGIAGAAIGHFLGELAFTSLLWWFTIRCSNVRFDTKSVLAVLILYVVGSILLLLISETVKGAMSLLYRSVLVVVFLGLIAYLTVDKPTLQLLQLTIRRLSGWVADRRFVGADSAFNKGKTSEE